MKALALTEFDAPPAVIDVPDPTPAPGEVLVRVAAASVNPYDAFVAIGAMKEYLAYEFPAVLGTDVAGTIDALGDGVDGFAVGDRVFGTIGAKPSVHDGSFAEMVAAQAAALARTPDGVDHRDVASLGVAGTTALGAVEALGPLEGAVVLILGATGGVGSFATQLAAARGARVVASVRPGDETFVTELGASETVDYTGDVAAAVRERHPDGLDGLIDLVNRDPAGFASVVGLVRAGGHATSAVGGAGETTEIGGVAVSNVGGNPALLPALGELVKEGRLRTPIRRTYPMDEAATALQDLTNRHTLGKLLITID
jgi:NADPH:quinone reductase-like Zn-dependent oxidoreductase